MDRNVSDLMPSLPNEQVMRTEDAFLQTGKRWLHFLSRDGAFKDLCTSLHTLLNQAFPLRRRKANETDWKLSAHSAKTCTQQLLFFFFFYFICGPQYRARLKITRRCPNGLGRRLDKGRLLPNAPVNVLGKVRQDVIAPNIFTEDWFAATSGRRARRLLTSPRPYLHKPAEAQRYWRCSLWGN